MCLCFPAGNVGNNDVHLWYDGQVHLTHHSRWFPFWTRGEVLSGIASTSAWFFVSLRKLIWLVFLQKMDRNRDGMVTVEEFIETCQKVKSRPSSPGPPGFAQTWPGVYFMLRAGWKYNVFHAALWARHLESTGVCDAASSGTFWA